MTTVKALLFLLTAALLEAGGDALVRKGVHPPQLRRIGFLLAGAAALFAYGYLVNAPRWDFGRSVGTYVAVFFVVAQIISWLSFGQPPGPRMVVGGACIIIGGLIISSGKM